MKGYVHSRETFGTVDGPGIRYVLFLQGCPMRCKYCHNPDTWKTNTGEEVSADEIIREYKKNREFYKNGGITVTGGEPMLQIEFVTELFRLAKAENIHTCIDTSGVTFTPDNAEYLNKVDELLSFTDLIMLDIKHINPDIHKELTGHRNENILQFAEYVSEKGIPLWIRHVIVPGITDDRDALIALGEFIGKLKTLRALDVLPYHTLGIPKYKKLGITYPLKGMRDANADDVKRAKERILEGVRSVR
ncbi:MAG: pyruvate formate lyase-activating protein [Oscillospiraceae bacterium]|nr:pyruvate formate lyase-activating protein [Oscillospiraceae bacterium]